MSNGPDNTRHAEGCVCINLADALSSVGGMSADRLDGLHVECQAKLKELGLANVRRTPTPKGSTGGVNIQSLVRFVRNAGKAQGEDLQGLATLVASRLKAAGRKV